MNLRLFLRLGWARNPPPATPRAGSGQCLIDAPEMTESKDASGSAVAYGTLQRIELDAKTAEHLAGDAGGGKAELQEWRIDALAIRLEPAAGGSP